MYSLYLADSRCSARGSVGVLLVQGQIEGSRSVSTLDVQIATRRLQELQRLQPQGE